MLIDRTRTVGFSFEGRPYTGFAGDTIASALAANDVWLLSRSFKHHRPRGIMSLTGADANTLVQLRGEPNALADRTPIREGLDVRAQNYSGSLASDRGRVIEKLSRFLPVGFYYKAFFKPKGAWKLWEPTIRRMAGLGAVDQHAPHGYFDKAYAFAEVAVIGGGRSGVAAANAAAGGGAEVVLIEQEPQVAGVDPRVRVMAGAVATGLFTDNWLSIVTGDRLVKLRASRVVLATGAQEQPVVFRGNDLPGVMLCSAAERLIRLYGVQPGRRAVVVAAGDEGAACAAILREAGVEIAAELDLRQGVHVAEAHERVNRLAAVTLSSGARVECDLVCMSGGFAPNAQLALHAGGRLGWDEATNGFRLERLPPHVEAVGALVAARPAHPYPIYPHPGGKEFVDFDEDLTIADLANAAADGFDHIELLKRYSTVGMGPSQGKHSALNAARILANTTGRPMAEVGTTTSRPPYAGEKFGHLAGRGFHPVRRTAMHHRHLELGAQMTPAGLWLRPAYYGRKGEAEHCVAEEARAVREGVGLIDVSTLGGLDVRGPDAAELLERMYTFGYAKLPVGRSRYVLMCDRAGAVMDDGVACRLHERHFYVTATTGAADQVYREMLWHNAQWRLDVDVANVTAAYAGINVAGPHAREVMAKLAEGVDLSAEAFPYLGVREGLIAGVPCRILRVGFVGELGYELHAPAHQSEALWDALLEAGREFGIRPFGVEAQRVLRLEKGHVIVGQDTDGLTFPHEIGMEWTIAKKPFWVGKAAVEAQASRPLSRKLVGFVLEEEPAPKECHLVIRNGQVVGRVTSVARSPALDRTIGLAYVAPDQVEPGSRFFIRVEDRRMVEAQVVALPFYDPENERQKL
jgi:sarcosine oxidase subunit alpha